jgi:phosphoglycolate phosphatase
MFQSIKSVIFDFDYTLADSAPGAIACVNFAFFKMGLLPASEQAICKTIGSSLSATYEALTGDSCQQRAAEFAGLFVQHAADVMVHKTVLFDTVKPTVMALRKRGLRLGIVSTKFRYRIEQILKRDGLADGFDVIVGGEDVVVHKPDPAGLLAALDCLGCRQDEALYVGDSLIDAETAKRARVAFVAVLSGVTPKDSFNSGEVHAIVNNLLQLSDLNAIPENSGGKRN